MGPMSQKDALSLPTTPPTSLSRLVITTTGVAAASSTPEQYPKRNALEEEFLVCSFYVEWTSKIPICVPDGIIQIVLNFT